MTTLLAVYDSKGCIGTCDARCYNASATKHVRCGCICGGRNHGVGEQRARELVAEGVGLSNAELMLFMDTHQLDLRCNELTVIDRTKLTDSRDARLAAYMKLNQLELPLDAA